MKSIAQWFTNERRQKVQAALVSILSLLVYAGVVTDGQVEPIVAVVAAVLQLAQGVFALILLRPSEAARWFNTVGRGLIYGLAGAVGPLGVAFRWWGDETAGVILTVTGLALSALAAFVQVVNVQTVDVDEDPPLDVDVSSMTRADYQGLVADTE